MKSDRKAELMAELEGARAELAQSVRAVHADLDVVARFKRSVARRKTAWLGGAALAGWVLSRLPGRKKKLAAPAPPAPAVSGWMKEAGQTGFWLALLNVLFNLFKPLLTTLATRKINQLASRSDFASHGKERKLF